MPNPGSLLSILYSSEIASQQDRLLRYRGGIFSSLLSVLYSSEIALLKMLILDSADAVESSKCS